MTQEVKVIYIISDKIEDMFAACSLVFLSTLHEIIIDKSK